MALPNVKARLNQENFFTKIAIPAGTVFECKKLIKSLDCVRSAKLALEADSGGGDIIARYITFGKTPDASTGLPMGHLELAWLDANELRATQIFAIEACTLQAQMDPARSDA